MKICFRNFFSFNQHKIAKAADDDDGKLLFLLLINMHGMERELFSIPFALQLHLTEAMNTISIQVVM